MLAALREKLRAIRHGLVAISLCLLFSAANASGLPWVHFRWVPWATNDGTFEKSALLVPVRIRSYSRTYWMELDTGMEGMVFRNVPQKVQQQLFGIYHAPAATQKKFWYGFLKTDETVFQVRLHVGKSTVVSEAVTLPLPVDMNSQYPMIGSIGLSSFQDKMVFIDFVHDRIAFISTALVKNSELTGFSFVSMLEKDGKLLIPATINKHQYGNTFIYDTGSSIFHFITGKTLWEELTGRSVMDPRNTVLLTGRFGSQVRMVGAHLQGEMAIGQMTMKDPMIYFDPGSPLGGSGSLTGIVGNAPFYECCMVVIDVPGHRFGIKRLHGLAMHAASSPGQ